MKYFTLSICLLISVWANAQIENSLHFDNVDDYITTPGASALISGSSQISISFWVFPENPVSSFPDYDGFCGFRNNTDADFYIVQIPGNTVEARFRNSAGISFDIIDSTLQLSTWQHFVLTYDGTELTLYKDGVISSSITANGNITTTTEPFYIGRLPYQTTNYYLLGRMDEVSLWNKTLSSNEVRCIYESYVDSSTVGLALYYKFNQGITGGINLTEDTLISQAGHMDGIMNNFSLFGLTSNWIIGVENYHLLTGSICHGQVYSFGTQSLSAPGTYFETYNSLFGCDSIVKLILTSEVNTNVAVNGNMLHSYQNGATYQWIDCDNANAPINNETLQDFTASSTGNYAVAINYNSCTDTSACFWIIVGGIAENDKNTFSIFPNPANNRINYLSKAAGLPLEITDARGQKVMSMLTDLNSGIDISSLSAGLYFIKISTENGILVKPFIRE